MVIKMSKKKVLRVALVAIVISLVVILITVHIHNEAQKKEQDKFNNTISKEVEYQMGNYINGGINVDGYTYVLVESDLTTGEDSYFKKDVILRIDAEGNCEEWYTFDDLNISFWYSRNLYYYDGWLYFAGIKIGDDLVEFDNSSVLVRLSIDDGTTEIIYEDFSRAHTYGVRDGLIFISNIRTGVFYLDIDDGLDFDKLVKVEELGIDKEHHYKLFGEWIYNCKSLTRYSSGAEVSKNYRQYYDGNLYTLLYDEEIDETTGERPYNIDSTAESEHVVNDVDCFNIFADKIYYASTEGDMNNIYRMNVDGTNKELLYSFPQEDGLKCVNLVVSDDNIICGLGKWVGEKREFYYTILQDITIINIADGTISEASTQESTEKNGQIILPQDNPENYFEGEIEIPRVLAADEDGLIQVTEPRSILSTKTDVPEELVDERKQVFEAFGVEIVDAYANEDSSATFVYTEENLEKYISEIENVFNGRLSMLTHDVSVNKEFNHLVIYVNEESTLLGFGMDQYTMLWHMITCQIYSGVPYDEWYVDVQVVNTSTGDVILEPSFNEEEYGFKMTGEEWEQLFE